LTEKVDNTFKICVVGDSGIGKENFVESFGFSDIVKDVSLKIGVDFYAEAITIETEKGPSTSKIHIWNFGGEERFKFLVSQYCKGANGIMLFFDLADRESFLHLNDWLKAIEKGVGDLERIPILLVGNKSNLEFFAVSPKEIDQFIGKFNLVYIETSTLTEEGISDSFYCITSLIIGIDINSEFFLSKDVIYRPNISRATQIHEPSTLTPQDLSNLSQKAIYQKLDILEKKIDNIKIKEEAISTNIKLKEKELELKERELNLKEMELEKVSEFKKLNEIKNKLQIFLSYSSKDSNLFKIREIGEKLTKFEKIENVLFYEGESYDNFVKLMNDNIGKCDLVLLFCSPNSLKSEFVEKEWTAAEALGVPIIPIFFDLKHIPPLLQPRVGVEYDFYNLEQTVKEIYSVILKKCISTT